MLFILLSLLLCSLGLGIGSSELLNLTPAMIQLLLPQPQFSLSVVLQFVSQYTAFMASHGLVRKTVVYFNSFLQNSSLN